MNGWQRIALVVTMLVAALAVVVLLWNIGLHNLTPTDRKGVFSFAPTAIVAYGAFGSYQWGVLGKPSSFVDFLGVLLKLYLTLSVAAAVGAAMHVYGYGNTVAYSIREALIVGGFLIAPIAIVITLLWIVYGFVKERPKQ